MTDPLIARFAEACGAADPLHLRVDVADGGVLAEGTVGQPFTLVGRDDACDVTLTDQEVNPRHTWLQVVGGRVFAVDLGSRSGLVWPNGATGSGWLDPGYPVRVGPFRVHLRSPVSPLPPELRLDANPLHADLTLSRPSVSIDFRNGRRVKDRWRVNRILTLIGRADGCKIHLHADDIARYHCGLVLTPAGLWVVDLSGGGVVVNGERMRVAPLTDGAELRVGRFRIGCHCSAPNGVPAGRAVPTTSPPPRSGQIQSGPIRPARPPAPYATPEDEVPLGEQGPDSGSGLPSSHIMCDAHLYPGGSVSGPISNPILLSGVGTPPAAAPPRPPHDPGTGDPPDARKAVPLLRQLGEIHGQMFDQFQQSLLMTVRAFGRMHRQQMSAMQHELARIQELNAELARLQAEVARLAVAEALGGPDPKAGPPAGRTVPDGTTFPELPALPDRVTPDASEAIQEWVIERMGTLQKERQARWQKLVGLFEAEPEG